MTARELREKYLKFFESKGHMRFPAGSLIPYDVTGRLDESLLFNGAGMTQFKPYFRGVAEPAHKRLITAQPCVRTGDIDIVGDETHLTFFEMMGNFSFGDYFKREAITLSWEFITDPQWLGLDPRRVSYTVFEDDDEAYDAWATHLTAAGIDPSTRIFRLGEESNYWPAGAFTNGPPGPCGPNSEMFYWTASESVPDGPYNRDDFIRDEAEGKWLEFWNDVFIQYDWQGQLKNPERPSDGYAKTGMPALPFQSVDTGMGLERTATVLGGLRSVYDTDLFEPIFAAITAIDHRVVYGQDPEKDKAMRIVADHIRTACFCICDGILPGNNGRGYVLRRLIRRAVLKGLRMLGFDHPFFHLVYEGVVDALGSYYTVLLERREVIVETLRNEEALFRRTLAAGTNLLDAELIRLKSEQIKIMARTAAVTHGLAASPMPILSGTIAFTLYDTFGFPLEVTREICGEAGVTVDEAAYEAAMTEAQERSRGASGMDTVYGGVTVAFNFAVQSDGPTPTEFVGYQTASAPATIVGVLPAPDEADLVVALDQTPFYAQSGGQVSDVGVLRGEKIEMEVLDVHKQDGVYVHLVRPTGAVAAIQRTPEALNEALYGKRVEAVVDGLRRKAIVRNHTATHLLHAALRQVLGKHVTQAGSYVGPDHLRFDFTHGKGMTRDEMAEVERIVNDRALEDTAVVTYADIPVDEAKKRGAMALFGEKYGNRVRMVEVADFSRELCGGIHVRATGEIGLFRILSEASAASGVRRIEAVTGAVAYRHVLSEEARLHEAAALLKASPKDLVPAIEKALQALRAEKQIVQKLRASGPAANGQMKETEIGGLKLVVDKLHDATVGDATAAADRLVDVDPARVAVVGLSADGKVTFVAKVGKKALENGAHAGNLVREIARIAGGGGGGRPDFATAGGKDASKLEEALAAAEGILRDSLAGKS